jgi:hypothetical protein
VGIVSEGKTRAPGKDFGRQFGLTDDIISKTDDMNRALELARSESADGRARGLVSKPNPLSQSIHHL